MYGSIIAEIQGSPENAQAVGKRQAKPGTWQAALYPGRKRSGESSQALLPGVVLVLDRVCDGRVCRWNRIEAARMPGMAAGDSTDGQSAAMEHAKSLDGFDRILGTGRLKPANRWK